MATTMNRYNGNHKERYESFIQRRPEMRYYFVHSFKDKLMRDNVVDSENETE